LKRDSPFPPNPPQTPPPGQRLHGKAHSCSQPRSGLRPFLLSGNYDPSFCKRSHPHPVQRTESLVKGKRTAFLCFDALFVDLLPFPRCCPVSFWPKPGWDSVFPWIACASPSCNAFLLAPPLYRSVKTSTTFDRLLEWWAKHGPRRGTPFPDSGPLSVGRHVGAHIVVPKTFFLSPKAGLVGSNDHFLFLSRINVQNLKIVKRHATRSRSDLLPPLPL